MSAQLPHAQIAAGRPVIYAGTARCDRGEMALWSNYSGTYQPIAAFRTRAGLPEEKFIPWQRLQMGGTAMQRGAFTERREAQPATATALLRLCRFGFLLALTMIAVPHVWAEAPGAACLSAIAAAEHAEGVPAGLLAAIGRVETGRRDLGTAEIMPWPWSVDANGIGRFFGTEAEAIAAVRDLEEEGIQSIDVGCLQVNLRQHPNAFASLAQAFDPAANAGYAARFLRALFTETGSWSAAAAAYHSRTPALGAPYERLVLAAWGASASLGSPPLRPFAQPPLVAAEGGFAGEAGALLEAASACVKAPPLLARSWLAPASAPCRSSPFASTRRLLRLLAGNRFAGPAEGCQLMAAPGPSRTACPAADRIAQAEP